jgi:hypothetical protein
MPMKIRNTTSVFVSSIIAMLVLGLVGIGSLVAISQSFAQANDTNANNNNINNNDNNGNDDNNDNNNVGYRTILLGEQEVPPINTQATGIADFSLSNNRDSIDYTIAATDIEGVTAGHIHFGIEGQNGPVAVTLFEFDSPQNEVSENGTIHAGDL